MADAQDSGIRRSFSLPNLNNSNTSTANLPTPRQRAGSFLETEPNTIDPRVRTILEILEMDDSDDDDVDMGLFDDDDSDSEQSHTLLYPQNSINEQECELCLATSFFSSRVCCNYNACNECLKTYISLKVQEAKVHIQCPNDQCKNHINRFEIQDLLDVSLRQKFDKFLIDANSDPCEKTCPSCSAAYRVTSEQLAAKDLTGLKVTCTKCELEWCFLCHAPYHADLTCKQFRKGDKQLKKWAKEVEHGKGNSKRCNAQKCPKCKVSDPSQNFLIQYLIDSCSLCKLIISLSLFFSFYKINLTVFFVSFHESLDLSMF